MFVTCRSRDTLQSNVTPRFWRACWVSRECCRFLHLREGVGVLISGVEDLVGCSVGQVCAGVRRSISHEDGMLCYTTSYLQVTFIFGDAVMGVCVLSQRQNRV